MKNRTVPQLTMAALIAALYVVLTYAFDAVSFGPIQFRLSEALNLFAFFHPVFILGVTLGCFLSNLPSPLGLPDLLFGTLHTFLSVLVIWKIRRITLASLVPALFSIIVAAMLSAILKLPLLETYFTLALSEVVICSIIGLPLMYVLYRSGFIPRFIMDPKDPKWKSTAIWPKFLIRRPMEGAPS
ncbi:Substrate-specific component QueT of predicted queuosine-regulated ECF transporter [Clostridiaceae bacterium JG1575]|nr:Substrate-specific component QueT of predicted queuosine-regulated ECF transporter [Clostridiaceae bacterium JG1575]